MTYRKRLTKRYECIWKGNQPPPGGQEGLPWERTQSWWLGEEEEKISRTEEQAQSTQSRDSDAIPDMNH